MRTTEPGPPVGFRRAIRPSSPSERHSIGQQPTFTIADHPRHGVETGVCLPVQAKCRVSGIVPGMLDGDGAKHTRHYTAHEETERFDPVDVNLLARRPIRPGIFLRRTIHREMRLHPAGAR